MPGVSIKPVTSKAHFKKVVASGKVVFVDIFADWCGPCKVIWPTYLHLASEHSEGDVEFYRIDISLLGTELSDLADELGVSSIPAFHVYKSNRKMNEVVGTDPNALRALVQTGLKLVVSAPVASKLYFAA